MGVPGSGKGTQAKRIAQKYNYGHISTGDLLRNLESDPNGDPSDKAQLAEMKAGKLVADDLIYKLAFAEMDKFLDADQGVVLDGAIRNVEQAKKYQDYFAKKGMSDNVLVLEIRISDETSFNRLTKRKLCRSCGLILPFTSETEKMVSCPDCSGELYVRSDDNPETAKKRIAEQGNVVLKPILDFYNSQEILVVIDGEPAIELVEQAIEKSLI